MSSRATHNCYNWDLSFIEERLVITEDISPDLAHRAVEEYRKFLSICKEQPHFRLNASGLVDVAWHAHILHTKRYAEFCASEIGRFIHHTPIRLGDPGQSYAETVQKIVERFGCVDLPMWRSRSSDPDFDAVCTVEEEADCGKQEN